MDRIGPTLIVVVGGIITLAMVAVAVSKNAQTASVIQGAGTALSAVIGAAVAPVSGSGAATFGTTTPTGGVTV
jgi:PRD1 phage membrane DNA delivery